MRNSFKRENVECNDTRAKENNETRNNGLGEELTEDMETYY